MSLEIQRVHPAAFGTLSITQQCHRSDKSGMTDMTAEMPPFTSTRTGRRDSNAWKATVGSLSIDRWVIPAWDGCVSQSSLREILTNPAAPKRNGGPMHHNLRTRRISLAIVRRCIDRDFDGRIVTIPPRNTLFPLLKGGSYTELFRVRSFVRAFVRSCVQAIPLADLVKHIRVLTDPLKLPRHRFLKLRNSNLMSDLIY